MAMTYLEEKTLSGALGAPKIAALAKDMDKLSEGNPRIEKTGDTFRKLALENVTTLKALNQQLENDPGLANRIKEVIKKNPEGFEKALPAMFKDPQSTARLVAQLEAPAAAPVAVAAAAPAPAPAVGAPIPVTPANGTSPPRKPPAPATAPRPPEPMTTAAPGKAPEAPVTTGAAAASPAAAATNTPERVQVDQNQLNKEKLAEIEKAAGYKEFVDRATTTDPQKANAGLKQAFEALTAPGQADPKETGQALDKIRAQIKADPNFFVKINKTLEEKPGATSSMISSITSATSASTGLTALSAYSSFSQSGFGQSKFGQWLIGLVDSIFSPGGLGAPGGLGSQVAGFMGMMDKKFAQGMNAGGVAQSNNGGSLTAAQSKNAGVSQDASMTVYDASGSKTTQTVAQLSAANATKQTDLQRQQQPGLAPAS